MGSMTAGKYSFSTSTSSAGLSVSDSAVNPSMSAKRMVAVSILGSIGNLLDGLGARGEKIRYFKFLTHICE